MSLEILTNLKRVRGKGVENEGNLLNAKQKLRNGILAILAALMPVASFNAESARTNAKSEAVHALSKTDDQPLRTSKILNLKHLLQDRRFK